MPLRITFNLSVKVKQINLGYNKQECHQHLHGLVILQPVPVRNVAYFILMYYCEILIDFKINLPILSVVFLDLFGLLDFI